LFAWTHFELLLLLSVMLRVLLQSIPEMREAFLIKAANGSWRLPRIGELCCRRPKLAQTLDKSECFVICW
jgi:hypothetical protein